MPAGKLAAPLTALTLEELQRLATRGLRSALGSPSQMRGRRALALLMSRELEEPKPQGPKLRDPVAEADLCLAQALTALRRTTQ